MKTVFLLKSLCKKTCDDSANFYYNLYDCNFSFFSRDDSATRKLP